jgi:hypothetical protein
MTAAIEIKDGDIFRWRYKDETSEDMGAYRRYHCKSQIARDGRLTDTFWGGLSTNISWKYSDALERLDLTHIANFADLDSQQEYMAAYYDDADCVNLNHSNSSKGNFYIRKDKASIIYKQTGNLRAVQILLGHTKIESTVRYLGVDVEDALALAEGTEV